MVTQAMAKIIDENMLGTGERTTDLVNLQSLSNSHITVPNIDNGSINNIKISGLESHSNHKARLPARSLSNSSR